jgi:hypothetical protein
VIVRMCGIATIALGLCDVAEANQAADQALAAMAGTLNVKSEPYMNGGKLSGCTLVFDAIVQDWSYRQGGYIKVSGNVGFLQSGGSVAAALKVIVLEIDPKDPTLGLRRRLGLISSTKI